MKSRPSAASQRRVMFSSIRDSISFWRTSRLRRYDGNAAYQHASRLAVGFKDGHLEPVQRQAMSGGEPRRTRADDGHPGSVRWTGGPLWLVGPGVDDVGHKTLQRANRNRAASGLPQTASLLALVVADPGADGRKRIGFADDPVSLFVFAPCQVRDVTPCFGAERTGGLARCADELIADKGVALLLQYVPLVLLAKITERAQHRDSPPIDPVRTSRCL